MPWAIFTKPFNFDYRPKKAVCRSFDPSDTPQNVTTEILNAAVAAGAAKEAERPSSQSRLAGASKNRS
jgi:hypothetical protein